MLTTLSTTASATSGMTSLPRAVPAATWAGKGADGEAWAAAVEGRWRAATPTPVTSAAAASTVAARRRDGWACMDECLLERGRARGSRRYSVDRERPPGKPG